MEACHLVPDSYNLAYDISANKDLSSCLVWVHFNNRLAVSVILMCDSVCLWMSLNEFELFLSLLYNLGVL